MRVDKTALLIASAVTSVFMAMPATAQVAPAAQSKFTVTNMSTYQRESDINANRVTRSQYTGVGALFTSTESTVRTGFGSFCSGSLISANIVVTAAHCLGEVTDKATGVNFYLPEYKNSPDLRVFKATGYLINPDYNGDALHGSDIAIVKLGTAPGADFDRYDIFDSGSNGELGSLATRVGLGTTGTGELGTTNGIDGSKRYGLNTFDITWDDALDAYAKLFPNDGVYGHDGSGFDAFGSPVDSILAYDFDDGTATHDVFGRYAGFTGLNSLGVIDPRTGLPGDSSSSPGDSGGPTFIDGKLAAITSFGISGNLFETGDCAIAGSVDPSKSADGKCTNSSFGDIGGDTRIGYFRDFLDRGSSGALGFSAFVPEPATWAMMIGGFGLVGGSMRRRKSQAHTTVSFA